ncbi:Asp23/Gls24 family envelope stress response protein [Rubneribacter sp.]|nr:Asp23/Gls24 family envelope stress response protein [Candidatus Rubneribacter avistercoris]
MTELSLEGMALAPGVVETIVSIAVGEVDGVASVGPSSASGLRSVFASKPSTQGIEVAVGEDDKLEVSVRIDVCQGYVLPELAANVRKAVADAVASQVGVTVGSVDVYIDGIQFDR